MSLGSGVRGLGGRLGVGRRIDRGGIKEIGGFRPDGEVGLTWTDLDWV